MEETPPRRRRPPPRDDGPSLPFIPIVLGVIVLGFVIGAGLSVAQHHPSPQDVAAIATSTPPAATASPTFAPAVAPRPRAKAKPAARAVAVVASPRPKASPSVAPEASPQASPSESAPPNATASPVPTAPVTLAPGPPSATSRKTQAAVRAAAPASAAPSTLAPATAAPATAAPPTGAPATATPAAVAHDDVTSDFGRLAAGVVRAYLAAIARGDTDAAYAQLGTAPNVSATALPEIGIVTRATRIVHVEARGGEDAVTVNVDMQTPSGAYFGQYTVHRSPSGAAVIVQHSIFKS